MLDVRLEEIFNEVRNITLAVVPLNEIMARISEELFPMDSLEGRTFLAAAPPNALPPIG